MIEGYKVDQAKYKSLVTGGGEDLLNAKTRPIKDRVKTEGDRAAMEGAKTAHDKVNQALKWYDAALNCGVPLLQPLKVT